MSDDDDEVTRHDVDRMAAVDHILRACELIAEAESGYGLTEGVTQRAALATAHIEMARWKAGR